MKSITYKIIYDEKWYYILTADLTDFTKKQVDDIEKISSFITKIMQIINEK